MKWLTKSPKWIDGDKQQVTLDYIASKIKQHDHASVSVGCDSHKIGGTYIFAIVVAIYTKGYGGFFFFQRKKSKDKRLDILPVRLMEETRASIESASQIRSLITINRNIDVHLDINSNSAFASYPTLKPATSWVKAMGFNPIAKPYSWAASALADAFAK